MLTRVMSLRLTTPLTCASSLTVRAPIRVPASEGRFVSLIKTGI